MVFWKEICLNVWATWAAWQNALSQQSAFHNRWSQGPRVQTRHGAEIAQPSRNWLLLSFMGGDSKPMTERRWAPRQLEAA